MNTLIPMKNWLLFWLFMSERITGRCVISAAGYCIMKVRVIPSAYIQRIRIWLIICKRVPVSRVVVNTPGALGGIGGTTGLMPALTLGCGAVGGSATSENVGPNQLMNVRYVAEGLRELSDIRAEMPGAPEKNIRVPGNIAEGGWIQEPDIEEIVEQIIKRLRSM